VKAEKEPIKRPKYSNLHSGLFSNPILYLAGLIYIVSLIYYPNLESFLGIDTFSSEILMNIVPCIAALYINADKEKAIAIKCNNKKSGVYRWTHRESGKSYIGSSVDLGKRFTTYYSYDWISSQAKSSIICKSLIKYGYSEFSLEILEYCNHRSDTIKREQFYLDSLEERPLNIIY